MLSDAELRLECARLVAVFSNGEGDQVEQTEKLFHYIKEGADGDRPVSDT